MWYSRCSIRVSRNVSVSSQASRYRSQCVARVSRKTSPWLPPHYRFNTVRRPRKRWPCVRRNLRSSGRKWRLRTAAIMWCKSRVRRTHVHGALPPPYRPRTCAVCTCSVLMNGPGRTTCFRVLTGTIRAYARHDVRLGATTGSQVRPTNARDLSNEKLDRSCQTAYYGVPRNVPAYPREALHGCHIEAPLNVASSVIIKIIEPRSNLCLQYSSMMRHITPIAARRWRK